MAAPSRLSRVQHVLTWVERLRRRCPIGALSLERVRFDTPQLQALVISGSSISRESWQAMNFGNTCWRSEGRCVYCGATKVPLQIEQVLPRSWGGSNRTSNLALACEPCNTAKATRTAAEFGHSEVEAQARQPLKDAAAVNATRWALFERLQALGLPKEVGTGGRTQWNRTRRGIP